MELSGWFILNFYSLVIAVILLGFQVGTKKTRSTKIYLHMLLLLTFLIVAATVDKFCEVYYPEYFFITRLGNYLTFALDPLLLFLILAYLDCWIVPNEDKKKNPVVMWLARIYTGLNLLFVTIGEVFQLPFFYYYENQVYHRGDYFLVRAVGNLLLCVFGWLYVIRNRAYINKNYRNVMVSYPVIIMLGGLLQVVSGGLNLQYAGFILSNLILYIGVQRGDNTIDYLTGTVNRQTLERQLERLIKNAIPERSFGTALLDVDHFKLINDTYGHAVGDKVLMELAEVIQKCAGDMGTVGRIGGDEFLLVLEEYDEKKVREVIHNIKQAITLVRTPKKYGFEFGVSIGWSMYDVPAELSAKEFQKTLDVLMYEEKETHHHDHAGI